MEKNGTVSETLFENQNPKPPPTIHEMAGVINQLDQNDFLSLLKAIRLTTTKELATALGVSLKTVYVEMEEDPNLPRIRTNGGFYRFPLGEVFAYLKKRSAAWQRNSKTEDGASGGKKEAPASRSTSTSHVEQPRRKLKTSKRRFDRALYLGAK